MAVPGSRFLAPYRRRETVKLADLDGVFSGAHRPFSGRRQSVLRWWILGDLGDLTTPFSGSHWAILGARRGVLEGWILAISADLDGVCSGPQLVVRGARRRVLEGSILTDQGNLTGHFRGVDSNDLAMEALMRPALSRGKGVNRTNILPGPWRLSTVDAAGHDASVHPGLRQFVLLEIVARSAGCHGSIGYRRFS